MGQKPKRAVHFDASKRKRVDTHVLSMHREIKARVSTSLNRDLTPETHRRNLQVGELYPTIHLNHLGNRFSRLQTRRQIIATYSRNHPGKLTPNPPKIPPPTTVSDV
ncbi:hypothetical protein Rs2_51157 [Raphanus sativus]|nr:hypothetical protein Rs2_51157 [Raphanus sativus]